MTVSADKDIEIDHPDESVADLRQRVTLRKAEVIHGDIAPRKNDRHDVFTGCVMPIFQRNIHKSIGNAFEKQFGV